MEDSSPRIFRNMTTVVVDEIHMLNRERLTLA